MSSYEPNSLGVTIILCHVSGSILEYYNWDWLQKLKRMVFGQINFLYNIWKLYYVIVGSGKSSGGNS